MTAAIFAARANLRTALIEEKACGGLASWTHRVENFPSYISISGMELMDRVLAQIETLGVEVDESAEIETLDITGTVKTAETAERIYGGKSVNCRNGSRAYSTRVGYNLQTHSLLLGMRRVRLRRQEGACRRRRQQRLC